MNSSHQFRAGRWHRTGVLSPSLDPFPRSNGTFFSRWKLFGGWCFIIPDAPWCWYIYLQNWVILFGQMLVNIPAPWSIGACYHYVIIIHFLKPCLGYITGYWFLKLYVWEILNTQKTVVTQRFRSQDGVEHGQRVFLFSSRAKGY